MCATHWKLVPSSVKARMLRHYTSGQERNPVRVSEGYRRACEAAIISVVRREANLDPLAPPPPPLRSGDLATGANDPTPPRPTFEPDTDDGDEPWKGTR